MEAPLRTIYFTDKQKNRLIRLKGVMGVKQYNIACRWAYCYSLSQDTKPSGYHLSGEKVLEISWDTFAGEIEIALIIALKQWLFQQNIPITSDSLKEYFLRHLYYGIDLLHYKYKPSQNIENFYKDIS